MIQCAPKLFFVSLDLSGSLYIYLFFGHCSSFLWQRLPALGIERSDRAEARHEDHSNERHT